MQDSANQLRELTKDYRKYDDELRALNSRVYELREVRKNVEVLMIDILKKDEFKTFNKLKINEDGSTIKIQRPQTWTKPWNISQKDLKGLIDAYFETAIKPNPTDCYNFILAQKKSSLIADEFCITRTVANENE
jgi:hypothetical protein